MAFGDSLSDPGNLFVATAGATPPSPYFQGHFSNGVTWAERLSGAPLNFFTFAAGRPGSVDFAFGGARTDTAVPIRPASRTRSPATWRAAGPSAPPTS